MSNLRVQTLAVMMTRLRGTLTTDNRRRYLPAYSTISRMKVTINNRIWASALFMRYSNCGKHGIRMIRMSSWMMWVMLCFMLYMIYCVAVLIRGSWFLRTCLCTATGLLSLPSVQTTHTGLLSTAHGTSRWKTWAGTKPC